MSVSLTLPPELEPYREQLLATRTAFIRVEAQASGAVYDRARCGAEYQRLAMSMYALPHVRTLVGMIALALGWRGTTRMVRAAGWLGWWWLRLRWSAGLAGR